MTEVMQADSLLQQAATLKLQALELINQPGGAENIEKAEKMLQDAEVLATKSGKMTELKQRADAIGAVNSAAMHELPKLGAFDGKFGNFLMAVKAASKGRTDPRLSYFDGEPGAEAKDLAEGTGSTGGYLVPTEFRAELMAAVAENSIVRPRSMIIPMARRTIEVPAMKQDGTTAGVPHWFGGMLAFWEAEANTMAETETAFRNITLTAHELTAVTHASNNLLADSAISLAAILTGPRGFPGVVAWKEDYAFLNGSGAGEPLGILNSPAMISIDRAGSSSGTIVYDDLANMMGAFMPSGKGAWVASISVKAALLKLAGPTATNYAGSYIWGSPKDGVPDSLFGFPIIFTEKLPALGTSGDIILADFSHYYIGDRQATTIDSTDQARWLRNQTSWKVTHRVDGQPWLNLPFTLADGSTKISPFVKLTTA